MTPEITWYNEEHNALLIRYRSGWTWDQHHALINQVVKIREERGLNGSLCLFDLRGTTMPFNSSAGEHYQDPHEGSFIVLVIDNVFTRTIAQLVIRARGHQHLIQIAGTLEEGKALLDTQIAKMQSSKSASKQSHH